MNLLNELEIVGNALFVRDKRVLILSDLHIGFDESLNANGFFFPRFQFEDLFKETQRLLKDLKPLKIILNGDIKHEFSGISRDEWKYIKEYLSYLGKRCEVILVKGNHDSILLPLAEKQGLDLVNYFLLDDLFICHGDKVFSNDDFKSAKTLIIGHEHPAVSLRDGVRSEKYKCFLLGTFLNKNLVVMPAMNPSSEGSDVLSQKLLSPYLKNNNSLKNFKVVIVDEGKAYDFGDLRSLGLN